MPRLHVQFFTRDDNAISRNCVAIAVAQQNFCVDIVFIALAMQHILKNCRKIKTSNILAVFLSAIFPRDGNAITSENRIAISSEKLPM